LKVRNAYFSVTIDVSLAKEGSKRLKAQRQAIEDSKAGCKRLKGRLQKTQRQAKNEKQATKQSRAG
jgi:hypothetical protein